MSEFNARQWVLDALESSTFADPSVVAADLANEIDSRKLRDALRQTLPAYVTSIATRARTANISRKPEDDDTPTNDSPRWNVVRSIFNDRVFTPDGWKMLRDCTRDDLLAAATDRQERAAALMAWGDKFARLADLLAEENAAKVGDLSEDDVRAVLA